MRKVLTSRTVDIIACFHVCAGDHVIVLLNNVQIHDKLSTVSALYLSVLV